jgi:drug/metabolite transporter (DMT)-like permease
MITKTEIQPKPITIAWVATALIASSIEPLVVKLGYRGNATAAQLLILKLIFGGLFIAPIYRHIHWVGKEKLRALLYVSGCFILNYLFVFYSLTTITATVLITIITTTPAVVAIINQFRSHEIAGPKFWLGFGICFVGVILTIDFFNSNTATLDPMGILLAFMSVATSAMYRTKMEAITKEIKPITISAYIFGINAIIGILCIPWIGKVDTQTWQLAAWIGFAGAIANVAFISALKLIGSTRISILTVLQRPLVIVLAALLLKEPLNSTQILGIGMVLIGIQLAKVVKKETLSNVEVEPVLLIQKTE